MDTAVSSTPTPIPEAGHEQVREEPVMNTEEKKPTSAVGAPNDSANNPGTAANEEVKPAAIYNLEKLAAELTDHYSVIHGSSNPVILGDAAAAQAALDSAGTVVANIFKAKVTRDAKQAVLDAASTDMQVALAPVTSQVRTTRRGREFYASCKSPRAWVTFRNLDSRLPASGLSVSSILLDAARAKAPAVEAAYAECLAARSELATWRSRYRDARTQVEQALFRLRLSMKRDSIGRSAEVIPLPPVAPPAATPVADPGAGQAA